MYYLKYKLIRRMSLNNNDISGRNMYLYNKNSEA